MAVNWTCDVLVDALANNKLADAAARVTNVALGSESQCLPTLLEVPAASPGTGPGPTRGAQSCTENLHESARGDTKLHV